MLRRLVDLLRRGSRSARPPRPSTVRPRPGGGVPAPVGHPGAAQEYRGPVTPSYAPHPDGEPDPGEVCWTWVPYEEDPATGKDRPVVVVGRATQGGPRSLAAVMLTSKDHGPDPRWLVLGPGAWDREGRVSSVRLDRVLAVAPGAVRREGSALDRSRYDLVAAALRARHRWP